MIILIHEMCSKPLSIVAHAHTHTFWIDKYDKKKQYIYIFIWNRFESYLFEFYEWISFYYVANKYSRAIYCENRKYRKRGIKKNLIFNFCETKHSMKQ